MPAKVTAGTKVYIGPQTTTTPADADAYAALTPWVEIPNIETIGDLQISRQTISFSPIGAGTVETYGGAIELGPWSLTAAFTPGDPAHATLQGAVASNLYYPFRLEFADKLNEIGTNTQYYVHGMVLSYPVQPGGNSDIIRTTVNIGVIAVPVYVAATAG